jgi:hypothetical protein
MHVGGTGPFDSYEVLALYDPRGERMRILDKTHLFALTLSVSNLASLRRAGHGNAWLNPDRQRAFIDAARSRS